MSDFKRGFIMGFTVGLGFCIVVLYVAYAAYIISH